MRVSVFNKFVIWGIILISLVIISFNLEINRSFELLLILCKTFSIVFILIYSFILSDELRDIISFKYKIVDKKNILFVHYLTCFWLFIPYWKPIQTKMNIYKTQNMFGAIRENYYDLEISYENEQIAIAKIENHKSEIKENRKKFFEKSKKEIKIIKYIK